MPQQVTILCPGPSLASVGAADLGRAMIIICVNRAIHRAVDLVGFNDARLVWCFLDLVLYQAEIARRPDLAGVKILTLQSRVDEFRNVTGGVLTSVWHHAPTEQISGVFTFPFALRYAMTLGDVVIHGRDQTDAADFDGQRPASAARDPERWRREQLQVDQVLNEH